MAARDLKELNQQSGSKFSDSMWAVGSAGLYEGGPFMLPCPDGEVFAGCIREQQRAITLSEAMILSEGKQNSPTSPLPPLTLPYSIPK